MADFLSVLLSLPCQLPFAATSSTWRTSRPFAAAVPRCLPLRPTSCPVVVVEGGGHRFPSHSITTEAVKKASMPMAAGGFVALLGTMLLAGRAVRALYFHIGETEKRCFIEEIPDETMVIGNYRTQLWDKQAEAFLPSTPGLGMFVEVRDPDAKVILSRQYGSEGRFTFTSHTPGEHQICLHSNSTRLALFAGGKLRVHLDIQVGEHANNYPEIAAKDKLTELQLRARQLLGQVEQIQKEQNYQRFREERFRMTSESTNQRVLWWSIAQTVILILTGIWQMRHLKSFFEAKKLV